MGHHFNLTSSIIIPPSPSRRPEYELVFVNTDTNEQVRMTIPLFGMFEDPTRAIKPEEVAQIADDIRRYLHDFPGSVGGNIGAGGFTP